jgi:asparagine synthase (glutamine-hydrolysing)
MCRGEHAIAFNGEIYNFRDLRADLEREGYSFESHCDTEVALGSWRRAGLPAVRSWRGMFGAAVWDRASEELWLLRDPWGIKPLYYHFEEGRLAFASEVRALLEIVPPELSRRGIQDFLRFGAVQDPVTMIDGVYALLPGHALRWRRGRIDLQRYAPDFQEPLEAPDIEPMLREIVRQQLISDVPVVVFLSGGVDSSVVALLARQEAGPGVQTLSVVFEEERYSERAYARQVAARIGTEHHETLLRGGEALDKAVEAISRMDQPTVDGINTYVVSEAARQAGFTVALSGLGGDEFFGGYDTFRRFASFDRLRAWAQRAPGLAGVAGRALRRLGRQGDKLGGYLESGQFREHPYFFQRTLFFPDQIEALCRAGRPCSEAERLAEARRQSLLQQAQALDPLNQLSLLEARTYMTNMLLRDSDQMSMAHSLELRVPLVDHLLAGRLLATPSRRKGFGRVTKLWLRQAFAAALPPEVFARPKSGFILPFQEWLRGPLRREVEGTLLANPAGLWDLRAAARVWEGYCRGRVHWSRPWALYVLSHWASRFGVHRKIERISALKSTI